MTDRPALRPVPAPPEQVQAVRRFNRFYTRQLGALQENLLRSPFTLTESRLLWELAHRDSPTATELARVLDLDRGYLSRLIGGLKTRGLVTQTPSPRDARTQHLSLSARGRRAFAPLDSRSQAAVQAQLTRLSPAERQALLQSMHRIEQLLEPGGEHAAPHLLRAPGPGDLGWVVARHGALYAQEYGWDRRFEALVARLAADYLERFEPTREAGWIVERDQVNLGCVFLVQARDPHTQAPRPGVAQLRMLLVEPAARGFGLATRLVQACEHFARQSGYQRIVLSTHANLLSARRLYQREGYTRTESAAHRSFGHDLVSETWERVL